MDDRFGQGPEPSRRHAAGRRQQGERYCADGTLVDADGDGVPDTCLTPDYDLNGDGGVSGSDVGLLIAQWGACPAPPQACSADFNADGVVDGADLGLLLGAWTG
ncbi:MAG: dockerin type I domain-containing protein [Phycisphaerales bacterium]